MTRVRIGISGWRYAPWRGVFYPRGLVHRAELSYAANHFDTLEINGSFYSLQRPEYYARWYQETPADFVFAVKGSRFITHMKRLSGIEVPLSNFFASGVLGLEDKLGPILWQFPETFAFDVPRFERFFDLLPRDTRAAAKLAKRHDARLAGRSSYGSASTRPLRHAVEVRSSTFATPEFVALLRRHAIALVVADTAGRWPYMEDLTADFVYVRLHGDETLYESGYSKAAIARWAKRVAAWSSGAEPKDAVHVSTRAARAKKRDVYVYFDNDIKVHAPVDAMALAKAAKELGCDVRMPPSAIASEMTHRRPKASARSRR